VMFADVMLPVQSMGVGVELTADGPVIATPVRTAADVARLRSVDVEADLGFVLEAIGMVGRDLAGRAAVVGLAGGPFTIAAYMIEGHPAETPDLLRRIGTGRESATSAIEHVLRMSLDELEERLYRWLSERR